MYLATTTQRCRPLIATCSHVLLLVSFIPILFILFFVCLFIYASAMMTVRMVITDKAKGGTALHEWLYFTILIACRKGPALVTPTPDAWGHLAPLALLRWTTEFTTKTI